MKREILLRKIAATNARIVEASRDIDQQKAEVAGIEAKGGNAERAIYLLSVLEGNRATWHMHRLAIIRQYELHTGLRYGNILG